MGGITVWCKNNVFFACSYIFTSHLSFCYTVICVNLLYGVRTRILCLFLSFFYVDFAKRKNKIILGINLFIFWHVFVHFRCQRDMQIACYDFTVKVKYLMVWYTSRILLPHLALKYIYLDSCIPLTVLEQYLSFFQTLSIFKCIQISDIHTPHYSHYKYPFANISFRMYLKFSYL